MCHRDLRDTIAKLNPVLRGWGGYFATGNAARKFNQVDSYVWKRLRKLLRKRKGRHLRAGEMRRWTQDAFLDLGIHRLRGTVRYPVASFPTPNDALAAVSTDAFFICPARRNAKAIAATGAPVFRYTFERALEQALIADLGAFHSAEIPFVFGVDAYPLGKVGSAQPLADAMHWTGLAKTGAPGEDWPLFDATETVRVLDVPLSTIAGYKTADCDFWDTL